MYNPPHPGEHVLKDCIEPLNLTITQAAKDLAVSRNALSELVNGRAGISPDMAVKLSRVFGASAESWLRLQEHYSLWHAQKKLKRWKPEHSYIQLSAHPA